ncbi:formyltransferase family protein [Candidatus Neomarinimicrobiota bacterium]
MKNIVFLVSGGGGSLKYLFQSTKYFLDAFRIVAIIGDRESMAISFAREQKIDSYVIKYKSSNPEELNFLLDKINPDIIITNIHKNLDISTLHSCSAIFINLHYSLLPSFKGLIGMVPVDQAMILNTRFIGVTSHLVSEELDGGKIISQVSFIPMWGKQDIKLIYDTVFQSGCIILLSTILSNCNITLQENLSNTIVINGNRLIFSDPIPIKKKTHNLLYKAINNL